MRQAFALALNKIRLVQDSLGGRGIATNHLVPGGMPGYNPRLKGPDGTTNLTGTLTAARALANAYADARCGGMFSACPAVTLITQPQNTSLANEARDMWLQAMPDYPITIRPLPFGAL
jgi:peptide/nickel transport system substrate-binding protein/oligopeptide transport system substrate-binding protein